MASPLAPGQISAPVYLRPDGGYAILRPRLAAGVVPATFEEYEERITAYVVEQRAPRAGLRAPVPAAWSPTCRSWSTPGSDPGTTKTLVVDPAGGGGEADDADHGADRLRPRRRSKGSA